MNERNLPPHSLYKACALTALATLTALTTLTTLSALIRASRSILQNHHEIKISISSISVAGLLGLNLVLVHFFAPT